MGLQITVLLADIIYVEVLQSTVPVFDSLGTDFLDIGSLMRDALSHWTKVSDEYRSLPVHLACSVIRQHDYLLSTFFDVLNIC